jgi:hypothetical protein
MAQPVRGGPARWELAALAAVIAGFWAVAFASQREQSVTYDEAQHLPAGLYYLRTGDFRFEPFNSPLTRLVEALPNLGRGVQLPYAVGWATDDILTFSWEFMKANAAGYHAMFVRSRMMVISLAAILILLIWRETRKLYGPAGALLAAAAFALDPTVIAHSQLVTVDLAAALTFFAAVFWGRGYPEKFSWPRAAGLGVLLGVAILAKISSFLLLALVPGFMLAARLSGTRVSWGRMAAQLAAMLVIAWLTLCSFYLWRGFGTPVRAFQPQSRLLTAVLGRLPAKLPVPLPQACVTGFDLLLKINQDGSYDYFWGKLDKRWWPQYFAAAMAIKTPLPALALLGLGLGSLLLRRPRGFWRGEAYAVIPGLLFFAFISLTASLHIGVRYLLPAYPLLYMGAGRLFAERVIGRRWVRAGLTLLVAGELVSAAWAYPNYLPYFNVTVGGSSEGWKYLADSNLDWGQDLIRLRRYQQAERIDDLCLIDFGNVDPAIYGIKSRFPRDPDRCPVLAVSIEYLLGFAHLKMTDQGLLDFPYFHYSYLLKRRPDAVVGASIWVFKRKP